MFAIKVIINVLVFYLFFSFLVGCTVSEDKGCVPIHIGTGYDEGGERETIYIEEPGCPKINNSIN
mgnify:CR=1 FL=1